LPEAGTAAGEVPPVLVDQPEPQLSPELTEKLGASEQSIAVRLRLVVREDGTVGEVEILEVRPPDQEAARLFADETAAYVKRWRYKPATRAGQPVPARIEFVVDALSEEE
jgi:hypothetical protein